MTPNDSSLRPVVLILVALFVLPALMMLVMMPMMGFWGWGHMGTGRMWNGTGVWAAWLLMMVLPVLVLTGVGYVLYRQLGAGQNQTSDNALEELRLAYARGELSDEEFEQRRDRLRRED